MPRSITPRRDLAYKRTDTMAQITRVTTVAGASQAPRRAQSAADAAYRAANPPASQRE